uniref:Transposon protein, CACTA, En/Spm sub-class n=1 Tax=Solanum tuberosum TaxID=4113 RepID=M1DI24_SOLTU
MKPLKTENEVDSSMKSTIRYTFVVPGAIGKGRGRGLKSLAERRDLSTKSFVSQSSDLVNEYMQEIETRKGRGQRLTNSTVLTSQGMTMIPKNFIDLEKENKQINRSAHASPNLGKGRGQGLTNSTLFTSQGMITISKNSIDLEKENKQINPSAHASTNLGKGQGQGLTNSTLFTSQGMITIPKNSIDLEKENKQINPSAHASTNLGSIGKGRGQGLKSSTLCTSQGMGMKYNNYMTSESEVGCINKSALYANQHIKTPSISTRANSTMSSSQEMQRREKPILEKEDMQTNLSLPPSIDQVMEHSQTTEKGSSNPIKVRRVRGSNMCKEVASLENGEKLKVTFYNNRTVGTNSKLFSRHLGKIVCDRNICSLGVTSWSDIKQDKLNHMWAAVEHKFEVVDMNDRILGWMNELWNKWRGHLHAKYVKDKPIQQSLKNIPRGVDKKEWEWLVKEHFTSESFQAQLEEMVQEDPSLSSIEIVEKRCGPQTRSHVFGYGGGVKAKDLKGGTSSKAELLSALRSTRDDNKFLNEENKSLNAENKSLNDRLSTLEDEMKEIIKMKELFPAQQSHVPPTILPASIE